MPTENLRQPAAVLRILNRRERICNPFPNGRQEFQRIAGPSAEGFGLSYRDWIDRNALVEA